MKKELSKELEFYYLNTYHCSAEQKREVVLSDLSNYTGQEKKSECSLQALAPIVNTNLPTPYIEQAKPFILTKKGKAQIKRTHGRLMPRLSGYVRPFPSASLE